MSLEKIEEQFLGGTSVDTPTAEAPEVQLEAPQEILPAVIDNKPNEEQAALDLERHFNALVNMEKYFPQIVKFAGRLCELLDQMGQHRHFDPTKTKFGGVKWYAENQGGHVVFDITPMGDDNPGYGKNTKFPTFSRLKAIDARFPQVVSVCFAIGSQLVKFVNSNKVYNHEIDFTKPVFFEGPNEHGEKVGKIRFQVFHGTKLIGPSAIGNVVI